MKQAGSRIRGPLLVAAFLLAAGGFHFMAPPQIIMLHGEPLEDRVFLTDLAENERFVLSLEPTSAAPADTAALVHVAFFYAPLTWARTARDTSRLRALRPADADQVAVLILGRDRSHAVLDYGRAAATRRMPRFRRLAAAALSIIADAGVTSREQ